MIMLIWPRSFEVSKVLLSREELSQGLVLLAGRPG